MEPKHESPPAEPNSQNVAHTEELPLQENVIPPPLPSSGPRQRARPPLPRSSLPPTPEAKLPEYKAPDPPPQVPPTGRVSPPSYSQPAIVAPTPRRERSLPATPSTEPLQAPSSETGAKVKKGNRFSKIMKMASTLSGSTPSTSATSTPLVSPSLLPPPVPSVSTKPSISSATPGIPPPTFSSDASGGTFDYMPRVGRKAAESECSAARFVQYFHHSVQWGRKGLRMMYGTSLMRASCFRSVVRRRGRKCPSSVPGGRHRSAVARKRGGDPGDETETLLRENYCHGMGQGWICCQSIFLENCPDC